MTVPTPCPSIVGGLCPTTTPTGATHPVPATDLAGTGFAHLVPWLLVAVVALTAVALAGAWWSARRRSSEAAGRAAHLEQVLAYERAAHARETSTGPTGTTPAADPQRPAVGPAASDDRRLVDDLVALADVTAGQAATVQLHTILRNLGAEPMPTAPGDRFDPDLHAAHAAVPAATPDLVDTVAAVHRTGWSVGRRLVRPTDVDVYVRNPQHQEWT